MKAVILAFVGVWCMAAASRAQAQSCFPCLPTPIAADAVTLDTLAGEFTPGVTTRPLPGFDINYPVTRTVTEIGSGGLYYVDYQITPAAWLPSPTLRFSMAYFQPPMAPGSSASNDWIVPLPRSPRSTPVPPTKKTPRLAIRGIEHCLMGAHLSAGEPAYSFIGDPSRLSFATYLPPWMPGLEPGGADIPRRAQIEYVEINKQRYDLILAHWPLVPPGVEAPASIVTLARNATILQCVYAGTINDAEVRTNAWPVPQQLPESVYIEFWVYKRRKGEYDYGYDEDSYYYKTSVPGFNLMALPSIAAPLAWQWNEPAVRPEPSSFNPVHHGFEAATTRAARSQKAPPRLRAFKRGDVELEWLGRAGVDLARYVLSRQSKPFDSLNQAWAGGTSDTNSGLAGLLRDFPLNGGTVSVRIVDLNRKADINTVGPEIIQNSLLLNNVAPDTMDIALDSFMDWIDEDNSTRAAGAENEYYQGLSPRYKSRNGPLIEIAELGYVRGFNGELVHGGAGVAVPLQDMFTTAPARWVNINTAGAAVLQLFPGVDGSLAKSLITMRAGPDGLEGNGDDMPFRAIGEVANVPGMTSEAVQSFHQYADVRSTTFEVTATAKFGRATRTYLAWVRRESPQNIHVIKMREL